MPEDKKLAFLSLKGGGAPMGEADGAADAEPEAPDEGLHAAAEDAMAAVKSGDAKAFLSAIRGLFDQLQAAPPEPDEHEGATAEV